MSSSNPLYYTGEKAKALITLPGLAQLAYDVNQRLTRQGNALYTINSTKDLTILIKLIPPSQCYGVLLQGNDGPHNTPIMIHNHRYYVLDSLGNAPSYGDIEKAIKNCYEKTLTPEVFYSNHMRQSDTFSCGSDALIIIEEALRIGSKIIDERLSKDEKYLHPALVKYTQGVARVKQINRKGVSPQTYSLLYPEELKNIIWML